VSERDDLILKIKRQKIKRQRAAGGEEHQQQHQQAGRVALEAGVARHAQGLE
jgi:hypothetical protein